MLKIYKRPGRKNWYMRGTVRGRSVEESTGTGDRQIAEAVRIKREGEILHRSVHGDEVAVTFQEVALAYMQGGGEKRFLAPLIKHFANVRIVHIKQQEIDKAAAVLYPSAKPATRNRQVYTPISAILSYAHEHFQTPSINVKRPKVITEVRRSATPDQLEAFLSAANKPHIAALAFFMAYTGRRITEAVNLTWDDLDLQNAKALIGKTKNGEPIFVDLHVDLLAMLANLPDKEDRVFNFTHRHSVYGTWRRTCKRAGIPYITPHEMGRHTFATFMRRYGGLDLRGLMAAGGWKSVQSVVRYAKVAPDEVTEAVSKLPTIRAKSGPKA